MSHSHSHSHPPQLECSIHDYVVQRPVNEPNKVYVTGPGDSSLLITMINPSSDSYIAGHLKNTPDSESIDLVITILMRHNRGQVHHEHEGAELVRRQPLR